LNNELHSDNYDSYDGAYRKDKTAALRE